jgi:hypothetical protein
MVHFIEPDVRPACDAFQNAWFYRPDHLSAQFVLARLAWTVLELTRDFNDLHGLIEPPKAVDEEIDQPQPQSKRSNTSNSNRRHVGTLKQGEGAHPQSDLNDADEDTGFDEERELAEDLETAMRHYPDVFAPLMSSSNSGENSAPASPMLSYAHLDPRRANMARYYANTLSWYPGVGRTERIAKAYMEAHPEVRQMSDGSIADPSLSGDLSDS